MIYLIFNDDSMILQFGQIYQKIQTQIFPYQQNHLEVVNSLTYWKRHFNMEFLLWIWSRHPYNFEVTFLEESMVSSGSVVSGTPESIATSFDWSTFHWFFTFLFSEQESYNFKKNEKIQSQKSQLKWFQLTMHKSKI